MRRFGPGEQVDEAVLKDEGYAYAGIEAPEVGGHGGDREVRTRDIGSRAAVLDAWGRWRRSIRMVFCRKHL